MPGARVTDLLAPATSPRVIAHRGASAGAPENTMPAFEAAWACGANWIEADVQPTVDHVPIILHDDDLDRTTDGFGPVRRRSASEIATLDAGSWFDAGGIETFRGTPVPLLAEVVAGLSPRRALLLEIKGSHTRDEVLAEMVVVRASGWNDRVLFESFEIEALRHVCSIEPGRGVGLLVEALDPDPVAVCAELRATAYNPEHLLLRDRPTLVGELHAAHVAVLGWTADDPDDWAFLTDIGVDGIITNTPGELLAWQDRRPGAC